MKIYCNACSKYRRAKKLKYICFKIALSLSIVYGKCVHEYEKINK